MKDLKKEFKDIWINEHGYANFCCEDTRHDHSDDMEKVWNFFEPHLVSREQVVRDCIKIVENTTKTYILTDNVFEILDIEDEVLVRQTLRDEIVKRLDEFLQDSKEEK